MGVNWLPESSSTSGSTPARKVRVLDYACGPGTVSTALLSYATSFTGIDLSTGMVDAYNANASRLNLPSTKKMSAIQGDLLSSPPSPSITGPEFYNFDLAAVGMGFHHFSDPLLAAKRLVERLKPGTGVLLITDFLAYEQVQSDDPAVKTVAHHGFTKEKIESVFTEAGCVDVDVAVREEGVMWDYDAVERKLFFARGRRE